MKLVEFNNSFDLPSTNSIISESDFKKLKQFQEIIRKDQDKGIYKVQGIVGEFQSKNFRVTDEERAASENNISDDLKSSILIAKSNIETFAIRQLKSLQISPCDTSKGLTLWAETRPIDSIGLYIPGGSAPLFSSFLMQAIPALVAGCKEIVVCTPPDSNGNINPAILWISSLLKIKNIYKIGGSQAIFAMASGTESIPKVDKIYGPGNIYVTEAKKIISQDVAIDMPAGPSEVFVVGNDINKSHLIASDLLSQLEHGEDSRAVLCTINKDLCEKVKIEIENQSKLLSRKKILTKSLDNLFLISFKSMDQILEFINNNAPEHLIIIDDELIGLTSSINNAGSVFLGPLCPESFGDYASGSNHTLPTNGYAKTYSGLSVKDFTKTITFQKSNKEGFTNLSEVVKKMSSEEGLDGHTAAVIAREDFLQELPALRTGFKYRSTNETKIYTNINIDGSGIFSINTGIKFFDHMLEQLAKHGGFDFVIEALGDIDVDEHHTIEDVAITLAEAFKEALSNRNTIERYSHTETLIMDEAVAKVSIDMASRPNINIDIPKMSEYVGDFPTEMFPHFFISFVNTLGFNCHINVKGTNSHHIIESAFKSFARSLSKALELSSSDNSTKGHI